MNQPIATPHKKKSINKMQTLCQIEGMNELDILEQSLLDGICPGICMNNDCDSVYHYEPDQTEGYCEECGTNSVVSYQELLISGG